MNPMSTPQKSPFGWPGPQGLWHPSREKDACGVGFIAHLKGKRSHDIIVKTLTMNNQMDHRGASGSDPATGDGAGIFTQMPDKFLRREMAEKGVTLPPEGSYGSGLIFFSPVTAVREVAMQVFEHIVHEEGQKVIGWRTVPVKSELLGKTSGRYEPVIKQIFIEKSPNITDPMAFERKLYVIRKRVGYSIRNNQIPNQFRTLHGVAGNTFPGADYHYVTHLSARTMLYKGMLTPCQLSEYFPDLLDPDYESALASPSSSGPSTKAEALPESATSSSWAA
jgi:glutamate synthase domain-containing protein 1